MADTDTTQEQDKQGGGFGSVAGGAVAGVGGGVGIAQLTAREDGVKERLAAANKEFLKADAEHKGAIDALLKPEAPEANRTAHKAWTTAKNAKETAEKAFDKAHSDAWYDAIKSAPPADMQKLTVANLDARLKEIDKLPEAILSKEKKALAKTAVTAERDAVKAIKIADFPSTTEGIAAAHAKIGSERATAFTKTFANNAEARKEVIAVLNEHIVNNAAVTEAIVKAAPKEIKIPALGEKTKLDEAVAALKGPESAWNTIAEAAKEPKAKLDAATKAVKDATALKELNGAEHGFFKAMKERPVTILKHGTNLEKLAIIGGGVAVGVATYMGLKSFRSRARPETEADQVMAQAAAPDQSQSQGAARA